MTNPSVNKRKATGKTRFKRSALFYKLPTLSLFDGQKQLQLVDKVSKETQEQSATELFEQLGIEKLQNKHPMNFLVVKDSVWLLPERSIMTIILADEPTASLDSKSRRSRQNLSKRNQRKTKATIMVTHDTV